MHAPITLTTGSFATQLAPTDILSNQDRGKVEVEVRRKSQRGREGKHRILGCRPPGGPQLVTPEAQRERCP